MTDQQINEAIAAHCGWTGIRQGNYGIVGVPPIGYDPRISLPPIPDYCNDLNAIHEAEQAHWIRHHIDRDTYREHLSIIVHGGSRHWYRDFAIINALMDATAHQRAEAFLKTVGKWEDGQ